MPNSGPISPRTYPPCFLHPQYHEQPAKEEFKAAGARPMEEHGSICIGHQRTVVHFAETPGNRRFIVEVVLDKGKIYIESPCTFTPALGLDVVDGNLAHDAEEWILVQQLRMHPRRLKIIFGNRDRLPAEEYVKAISAPHAGRRFQDVPVTFDTSVSPPVTEPVTSQPVPVSTKKKWWKFW